MNIPSAVIIKVGRRVQDGTVSLSVFLPGVLSLNVSRRAERAGSVLLTREQARQLRQALDEFEILLGPEAEAEGGWDGSERRESGLAA